MTESDLQNDIAKLVVKARVKSYCTVELNAGVGEVLEIELRRIISLVDMRSRRFADGVGDAQYIYEELDGLDADAFTPRGARKLPARHCKSLNDLIGDLPNNLVALVQPLRAYDAQSKFPRI